MLEKAFISLPLTNPHPWSGIELKPKVSVTRKKIYMPVPKYLSYIDMETKTEV